MLITPLGRIKLFVNNIETDYEPLELQNGSTCPDVSGRFLIQYDYKPSYGQQIIRCVLPDIQTKGYEESGEQLEAISFYKDDVKLTIGFEGEFYNPQHYDYSGKYLETGIEFETLVESKEKAIRFCICWIQPCTEENDIQTWLGADPTIR